MYLCHLFILHLIPKHWGFKYSLGAHYDEIIVNEELPNYFSTLKNSHCDEIIAEYREIRNKFDYEIEDYRVIREVMRAKKVNSYENKFI